MDGVYRITVFYKNINKFIQYIHKCVCVGGVGWMRVCVNFTPI